MISYNLNYNFMRNVPLLILLWATSCIRAVLIVGCLLVLYFAVRLVMSPENSKDIDLYFPAVVGGILFLGLLMKDVTWVEKKKEELSSL